MSANQRRDRASQPTTSGAAWQERFPVIAYDDLPAMPIGKGDVTKLLELVDAVQSRSVTTALSIVSFIAGHRGRYTGYAMQRRTDLLSISSPSDAALWSARQYLAIAPLMGSSLAEPCARLAIAETTILKFVHGRRVSWTSLIDKLTRLRLEFSELSDTGEYEGRTSADLAFVYFCQANTQPETPAGNTKREILYGQAVHEFQRSIVLLSMAFDVRDIIATVQETASDVVAEVMGSTGTGRASQPA